MSENREISSNKDSLKYSYSDRPMPIEPGLSNDISPISFMTVKLAIMELIRDKSTTLHSLEDDLNMPYYLWFNRRDPMSQIKDWHPLENKVDGMRILRWYGIDLKQYMNCSTCSK